MYLFFSVDLSFYILELNISDNMKFDNFSSVGANLSTNKHANDANNDTDIDTDNDTQIECVR